MKEDLKDIFSNVNEWLKFAEAKNAALIALNLASIFGAITVITQTDSSITVPKLILIYLYQFIILNGLGISIALYSFWPQMQVEHVLNKKIENIFFKKSESGSNLLYYGHIKDYDPALYIAKLCESCEEEVGECSGLESDYASQIVINSRIAVRKYIYFKAALFCTISAVLTPIISILLAFLLNTTNCLIMKQYKKSLISFLLFILLSAISWKLGLILWKVIM